MKTLLAIALFLPVAALAQGPLTPPGAPAPLFKTLDQVEPRRPIFALPTNLTVSGSYYVTSNLTCVVASNGIGVFASDVTIDLNGFALIGSASTSNGIDVGALRTNIAIRNGTIRGWGGDGLDATGGGVESISLENLRVQHNGGSGIKVGPNSLLSQCTAERNTGNGIEVSTAALIQSCAARNNAGIGFTGFPPGTTNFGGQFIHCQAVFNGSNGFSVQRAQIVSCVSAMNRGHGIDAGSRSMITDCKVMLHPFDGIRLGGGNVVTGNHVVGTGTASSTTNACITAWNASGNRIENNHVQAHDSGIIVTGNLGFVFRNTSQANSTNFIFLGTMIVGPTNGTAGVATNHPWANFND